MMNDLLAECFEHNRWANLRLADALLAVDPAVLETGLDGAYGAILPTMRHIAFAEQAYLLHLRGLPIDRGPEARREGAGMAEIRAWLDETGAALTKAAREAVPAETAVMAGEGPEESRRVPAALFFVQALDHGREHRTQVTAALTLRGVTPPDLDGWTFYRA